MYSITEGFSPILYCRPDVITLRNPFDTMKRFCICVCVCVCFLPIHSGHQVRWTYQPGSHRRKVLQPMFPPKPLDTLPLEVDAQKV